MSEPTYEYYHAALDGLIGPIVETEPQPGFYRIKGPRGMWRPVAIWREGNETWVMVGNDPAMSHPVDTGPTWLMCAKHPVHEDDYRAAIDIGRWLTDPPADVAPAEPKPDESAPPGPGHNSGDPASFDAMRAELEGDIAEARAFYARNPLRTKVDADKCENWRDRIAKAGKAMDERRKGLVRPLQDEIDAINGQHFPVIRAAEAQSKTMGGLRDGWIRAEQERLRREAEAAARAKFEAERAAAEAERKRLEEERAAKLRDDPVAALTEPDPEMPPVPEAPEPVALAPKVMVGTGARRTSGSREPATAVVTDFKALAVHCIDNNYTELIDLLQKIANRAARGKGKLPGVRMSWETKGEAAA
jgi:hypothetical protein